MSTHDTTTTATTPLLRPPATVSAPDSEASAATDAATGSRSAVSTEAMMDARRRDSAAKRARVLAALRAMLADGAADHRSTALARRAQVSTWLVYAPGIRDVVEHARTQQHHPTGPDHAPRSPPHGDPAARRRDLRTDLALARAEITRLRADRDQHRRTAAAARSAPSSTPAPRPTSSPASTSSPAPTPSSPRPPPGTTPTIHTLHERVTDLEDDLAAARTSLRRMIRAENLPPTPSR